MDTRIPAALVAGALSLVLSAPVPGNVVLFVRASAPGGGDGSSWDQALPSLVAAFDAAAADPSIKQIWVAAGSYTPRRGDGSRNDSFVLVSGLGVYGGFAGNESKIDERDPAANLTILSGDLNSNDGPMFAARADNAHHVVRGTNLDGGMIDGFTIRGGHADFAGEALLGGGAMYLLRCAFTVSGCVFADNAAGGVDPDLGGFGGAMLVRGGSVAVSGCRFQGNRGMNGGALGVAGFESDLTDIDTVVAIADCEFLDNFSPSQTGGAIWSATGDPIFGGIVGRITVLRSTFINNRAEYYGAWLDQNTPEVLVEDCLFRANHALVAGGAFALSQTAGTSPAVTILRRCVFEQNGDTRGSAVFSQVRPLLLDACIVRENLGPTAVHSGPTIGFSFAGESLELRNCLVHDNIGTGVFAFRNPMLKVVNCTVARNSNTAQQSGFLAGGIETSASVVEVTNTVLWGNDNGGVMDQTAQIRSFDSAPAVNFSIVQGLTGSLGGAGNLGDDPVFVDAAEGDFRTETGSPAIDAGRNAAVPPDLATDLDGGPRFVDDPETPDTGEGTPPIVDIGAYEFAGGRPTCPADFNDDGAVNSQDFFDFLGAFFVEAPKADFNADGTINSQDFFDFLAAFFEGC